MVRREGNYWRVQIQRGGVLHSTTFATRAEAEAFQAKIIEDHKRRRTGTPLEYNVVQAFHRWTIEELPALRSKRFTKNHALQLTPFLHESIPLSDISRVWDAYKRFALDPNKPREKMKNGQFRKQERLSNATINRKGAILRRIANLAFKSWGWLHTPVHIELLPEPVRKRNSYITKKELYQLVSASDDEQFKAMMLILFYSGMRIGEALTAKVVDGYFYIPETKNGKSRTIKIHPSLSEAVSVLPFRYKYKYFQLRFIAARNAIERPDLKIHDVRHSFASHLLHSGKSIKVVSELLGHSSIAITADIYSHIYRPDLDSAIDSM